MSLKDLPSPNAPNFQLRVREMLHTMLGKTGSADERLLTLREAVASGVVKPGPGGSLVPGDAIGGGTGGETYEPDLTPPPTPTGFSVDPAIGYVFIQHDAPLYLQGHGHLRTRVYGVTHTAGSPLPVFADAVEVGQFEGTVWALPSNPATTWHLWIKWETRDGVLSASPAGGTNGAVATTAQDVAPLLDALAGQIGSSQLANDLATRIDLIDGTGPGSVAQRIADEATARAVAILAETNARAAANAGLQDQIDLLATAAGGDLSALLDAVNQERDNRITDVLEAENAAAAADALLNSALATEVDARELADTTLGQVQSLLATQSAAAAAAIVSEQTTRIEQDAAQVKVSQALQASVGQSAAGLLTEQTARATETAALAASTAILAARVGDATAAIAEEQSVRADADSAQANVAQTLAAVTQQAAAAIALEQQVRATDDAATATVTQTLAAGIAEADAAIVVEQQVRSTADSSTASQIQSLSAKVGESAAAIQQEQDVRASADLAQAGTVSAMAASVGAAAAAITAEQSVRATDDAAQAAASTALAAAIGDAEAAILAEQQVRTTDDLAIASQSVVLAAQLGSNVAGLVQEATVRAADDSAAAAVSAGILAQAQGAAAAISVEQQASASADAAIAGQVAVVGAQLGAQAAAVQVEQTARVTEDAALAAQSTVIRAQAQESAAALQVEQQVRADADGAASTQITSLLSQSAGNAAGLLAEQTARTTEDAALSQQTSVLYAQAGTQAAAVQSEAVTRATDDSAQAAQVQAVSVAAGEGIAAVRSEESARATADAAQAATSSVLAASLSGNAAAILTEQSARVTDDTSLAQRVDALTATTATSAAAIVSQQQTMATQDSSLASQISALNSATSGNTASIATVSQTVTDNFNAQAGQITTIQSRIGGAAVIPHNFDAGLVEWTNARDGAPDAVPDAAGTIVTDDPDFGRCLEIDYFDTANERLCPKRLLTCTPGRVYKVTARFKIVSIPADGSVGIYIRFFGQSALYAPTTNVNRAVTSYTAPGVYELVETISNVSVNGSLVFPASSPYARVGLLIGSAETGLVLRVERIQVEDITSLTSAVQVESDARASETGELFAKYTVKVDVAGHVSGYGLASTANNGAVVSQFGIRADQFFVAPPATSSATAPTTNLYKGRVWVDTSVTPNVTRYYTGSAWSTTPQALPFVVQATPTTIDGQVVPAGVYMDAAYIRDATITNAKIANLAVDDAKIANLSVSKLTAGSLAVGQYAQSTGYVAGSSGWRINGDGTAEFSGVVVRGTIFASQGAIGGWTIGSNYLQSTTYALGTSGTRLNSDGTGQIGGVTIYSEGLGAGSTAYDTGNGAWIGRDGKFSLKNATNWIKWDGINLTISGELQGATGTFSGALTASAVNAVDTINLAGNAITAASQASFVIPLAYQGGATSNVVSFSAPAVSSITVLAIITGRTGVTAPGGSRSIMVYKDGVAFIDLGESPFSSDFFCGSAVFSIPAGVTSTFYIAVSPTEFKSYNLGANISFLGAKR